MEVLRWILFVPSAFLGYVISITLLIPVAILIMMPLKVNGVDDEIISGIGRCIGALMGTYGWFAAGMYVAPKKPGVKVPLYVLNVLMLLILGAIYPNLMLIKGIRIGNLITFLSTLAMMSWIWFSSDARKMLTDLYSGRIVLRKD